MRPTDVTYHRCVCMNCAGQGYTNGDYAYDENVKHHVFTPGPKCRICLGKGLVNISAIPDSEENKL